MKKLYPTLGALFIGPGSSALFTTIILIEAIRLPSSPALQFE